MDRPRSGPIRFRKVISLFLSIFWAFYSLKLRKLWRSQTWYEERRREDYSSPRPIVFGTPRWNWEG